MKITTLFILDTTGCNKSRVVAIADGFNPVSSAYDALLSFAENHMLAVKRACKTYGFDDTAWKSDDLTQSDFAPFEWRKMSA